MLLIAGVLLLSSAIASGAEGVCVCAGLRERGGWCPVHDVGYVGGLKVTSAWLFETVDAHGHDVDVTTFVCPACKKAIATDGFCDEHRIGFLKNRAYFSWLTFAIARGDPRKPSDLTCAVCRKNAESTGWCERHKVGMVGMVAIRDRADFDRTVHALEILERANREAARCEHCAAAMVTDTECAFCRIRYKDGKPVR